MKKRILVFLLSAAMVLSTSVTSFATEDSQTNSTAEKSVTSDEAEQIDEGAEIKETSEMRDTVSDPQVGDIIWIKKGSVVFKDYTDASKGTHTLILGDYEVKITEIIQSDDGTASWYEFEFTNLGFGEVVLQIGGYKYVEIENTSATKPEEDPTNECTCGSTTGTHEKDCPLYSEDGFNLIYVDYTDITESGINVNVSAPEGAFPEGINMSIEDTTVDEAVINSLIKEYASDMEVLGLSAVEISFGGTQPTEEVILSLSIPTAEIPENANKAVIVHFGENGPEIVKDTYLQTEVSQQNFIVTVDGFSSYAAVYVNSKYSSQKLSDVLADNTRYSIQEFSVDLFDYDPGTINDTLDSATSDAEGFHFVGYGDEVSNNGINNSVSTYAKQGIVDTTLTDGLPVFNFLVGEDAGTTTGEILFSDSETAEGKTVYNDIPFEFVYDNKTGFYEYKSSANHAQLNDTNDKIELYADTLSTDNAYVETLDLSTAFNAQRYTGIKKSTESFQATAKKNEGDTRLDPYVSFPLSKTISADKVGQIYVKAKIPASVGANTFQLFFERTQTAAEGMAEDRSYKVSYTATGEWIEFVIDTSDCSNWNGTIKNLRIDLFDFGADVSGSDSEYSIEIAQISLIEKEVDTTKTRGGFYPFSDIADSYPGNNTKFDLTAWGNFILDDDLATITASRSIGNPYWPNTADARYSELAFGVAMEFDFYIPVDKTSRDLTYYFNGDDDLWVFVDDQLVLDIGGGHGAIMGTINFTTGKTVVENAVQITGYDSNASNVVSDKEASIDSFLTSAGKHTMKIFYLERGSSVSNCFMKFNLPQTPTGSVKVTKEVAETNNADLSTLKNAEFRFQMTVKDLGTNGADTQNWANQLFYVIYMDPETKKTVTEERSTDANGYFQLKHGEEAVFDIPENYDVTVEETPSTIEGYTYVSTTVNGESTSTLTQTTEERKELLYAFVNTYKEENVTLTYVPVNPTDCPDDVKGTVELTGDKTTATHDEKGVSETIGVSVGTPKGSTATDTTAVKFVGWYSDSACTNLVSEKKILELDKKSDELWTEATYYAKFEYMYGNLQIVKSGIEEVDNHEAETNNKQEQQSTIYTVTGTSDSGIAVNMEVAIVGNDSITIQHLPVGEYTVTENQNWSWRYDAEQGSTTATVTDGETAKVSFENDRSKIYWLSGDNYCENWWGSFHAANSLLNN